MILEVTCDKDNYIKLYRSLMKHGFHKLKIVWNLITVIAITHIYL